MHPDVHRYLDGEIERDALSPDAARELAEWEVVDPLVAQRRVLRAPAGLAGDIMRALPPAREPLPRRIAAWLLTPRPVHVAPWLPLAAAAALAALLIARPGATPASAPNVANATATEPAAAAATSTVFVQFALNAQGARSVSVAGDFNDWSADSGTLRDPDGDGVWVGLMPVQPGVHKYMFVVDGEQWVTDPRAESYADDGFGMRNAVIGVHPPERRAI